MPRLPLIFAFAMTAGCATWMPPPDAKGPFVALPEFEGRVEAPTERLALGGGSDAWIGLVIARPTSFSGQIVVLHFLDDRDPDYRLLDRNRGCLVTVEAKDGRIATADTELRYGFARRPRFTVL